MRRARNAAFVAPVPIRRCKTLTSFAPCNTQQRRPVVLCCAENKNNDKARIPLFEMRGVTYSPPMDFDNILFRDMNFKIYENEFIVVVGQNGAGKSTGKSFFPFQA